jgi:hypothetical protein
MWEDLVKRLGHGRDPRSKEQQALARCFRDLAFQSLYHFIVGGYVDDPRLTTLPAYGAAAVSA